MIIVVRAPFTKSIALPVQLARQKRGLPLPTSPERLQRLGWGSPFAKMLSSLDCIRSAWVPRANEGPRDGQSVPMQRRRLVIGHFGGLYPETRARAFARSLDWKRFHRKPHMASQQVAHPVSVYLRPWFHKDVFPALPEFKLSWTRVDNIVEHQTYSDSCRADRW
jgi:hypothetical protein